MKRPQAHQVDELAGRTLVDALPPSWVVNEHHSDYGKDYLVEIADDDGQLTGISFFIQLKGQVKVTIQQQKNVAKFSLETKHAKYYLDQVRDLPLFLVVADVSQKCGWWLFLQRALQSDQSWRRQGSRTLHLPLTNTLHNAERLRQAVEDATDWMRQSYPEFHTPFLRQCFDYLCISHGLPEAAIFDDGMIEQLHLPYFPELPNGVPVFDPGTREWDCDGFRPEVLHLDIYSNGEFQISQGDDDGVYIDAPIRNPEEIGEILNLIQELDEVSAQDDSCVSVPLSSLVSSLDFIVPFHDEHLLVSPTELTAVSPQTADVLNAILDDETDGWNYLCDIGYPGWEQWCRENISLSGMGKRRTPGSSVCVYSRHTGVTTYRRWIAYGAIYRESNVPIAMTRATKSCSAMFLCDFLNDSSTGQNTLRTLLQGWQHFDDLAKEVEIDVPSTVLLQIRRCVEERLINRQIPR